MCGLIKKGLTNEEDEPLGEANVNVHFLDGIYGVLKAKRQDDDEIENRTDCRL